MTPDTQAKAMTDDMVLISVDDHVLEPATMFDGRMPRRFADRAPRVQRGDDGIERWTFEGRVLSAVGENGLMGKPPTQRGREAATFAEMRPSYTDVHERVLDMNAGGVLAALCFPTFVRFCGQVFAEAPDRELGLAALRAYNDWCLDEWCGAYPDRFIPIGLVPLWDPESAATEVRRVAARGCRAITFSENPASLGLPSVHGSHWDPLFAACVDNGAVLCTHVGSSSRITRTANDAHQMVPLVLSQLNSTMAAADWLLSPVFTNFPDLRVCISEGGISWIPAFLERVQHMVTWNGPWAGYDPTFDAAAVFRRNLRVCFVDDRLGIELRDRIGVETIMWESDFPHPDSTWPCSPEHLADALSGCTSAERDAITFANAARTFGFDPFAQRARAASTVGALRAEVPHRDLTTLTPYTGADKSALFSASTRTDDGLVRH